MMGTSRSIPKASSSRKLLALQIQQPFRHDWGPGHLGESAGYQTEQTLDSQGFALAQAFQKVGWD